MIILGIHDGHDSSVALMINGKIVYAAQEERFSRLKTDYGLPVFAIKDCLNSTGIKAEDINEVALGTKYLNPVLMRIKRNANFSVSDWIEEQEKFWKPSIFEKKKISYWKTFKNKKFKNDKIYNYKGILNTYMSQKDMDIFQKRRINKISSLLKISKDKIKVQFHEDCHKYYSYFFFKERKNGIAITSEGIGDYSNGSVSIVKNGNFELVAHNRHNHLGHIYQYITLLLGMKPSQHEYKVMGLAPYASDYESKKSFKIFDKILKIKDLNIVFDKKPKDLFYHFKKELIDCRFDGIAGGLQKFLEKKLNSWFFACSKRLSYKDFYFSGGVAQNIKAGMSLNQHKGLNKVLIPPAAGDTSISIGACYKAASDYCEKNRISKLKYIKPIDNMYLGHQIKKDEINKFINEKQIKKKYKILRNVKSKKIAKLIFDGNIIGRCAGKMEFGLRALGNRSILCDPRYFSNINKINAKIKKRDFWMPFTPSILKEDFKKFIKDPKNLNAKFMSMAFNTTKIGQKNLGAAIHPSDYTARPQKLEKKDNNEYYNIVKEFKKLSGVGALLNTSLNLHGLPIVRTVQDAFYVFENSDLDGLVVESFLFIKKK